MRQRGRSMHASGGLPASPPLPATSCLPILLQIAVVYPVAAIAPGPNGFMISPPPLAGRRSCCAKLAADR
ncbi:hypothetical protein WT21_25190 [Burkholderia territorii]|nr:hypothetical protein WT21_25190 [Burkholderia territorii]KWH10072.1 hypothetical protein WT58_09855 [Burkholderia territorii]